MNCFGKFVKRFFDIFISSVALIVLLIPWAIIFVIMKIQSPGPFFYKTRRVGLNGKIFTIYKIRSMRVDAGKIHKTTLQDDKRIFPLGKFLRKSKLDETPQFFNILKNDMSLIGPRPEDEANASEMYVGKYADILSVKPGLSSPASLYDYTYGEKYQSEAEYEREFLPQKMDLELYYTKKQSCFYDFTLIVRTLWLILQTVCGKKKFKKPKNLANAEIVNEQSCTEIEDKQNGTENK